VQEVIIRATIVQISTLTLAVRNPYVLNNPDVINIFAYRLNDLQSVASPDETPVEDDNGNEGEEVVDIKVSEILILIMILLFVIKSSYKNRYHALRMYSVIAMRTVTVTAMETSSRSFPYW
jgi:hypothetical protein